MRNDELLLQIIGQCGTPSYVFDEDELTERVQKIRGILGDIPLCYSIKANPFLTEALADLVDFFEVCSPGELAICKALHVPPEKIIYSGVHKDAWDIREAVRYGTAYITAESIRHYQLICEEAKKEGQVVNVLLRLTSGNQFGMSSDDIRSILSSPSENAIMAGLHYFAGTGRKKISKHSEELTMLTGFLADLRKEYDLELPMLEYGPGLAFPYFTDEDRSDTIAPLKELDPALLEAKRHSTVSVEMGRFIASSCGYYMTSICDIKKNNGATFCIVDGGINHINYLGQMMGMKTPVVRHFSDNRLINGADVSDCTICGSLCTTNDILVRSLPLSDPKTGDILIFENAGAYSVTEAMGLFLSRNLPRVFTHRSGKITTLRDDTKTWKLNCNTNDQ